MMTRKYARGLTLALLGTVLALAGCDRDPVDPPGHALLGTVAVLDRTATPQVVLATWTHDGGWDRDVLGTLSHGAEQDRTRMVLGVRMWTQSGAEIQLVEDGEYEARYYVDSDPDGVIDMDSDQERFHGDHVYVFGHHPEGLTGTAWLRFVLWHDGHGDGETDSIGLTVAP
jgi:hypothetical protein